MLHSLPQLSGSPVLRCSRFVQSTDLMNLHREHHPPHPQQHQLQQPRTYQQRPSQQHQQQAVSHPHPRSICRHDTAPQPMDLLHQQLQQRLGLQRQKSLSAAPAGGGTGPVLRPFVQVKSVTGGSGSGHGSVFVAEGAGSVVIKDVTGGRSATMIECSTRPSSDIASMSSTSSGPGQFNHRHPNVDRYSAPPNTAAPVHRYNSRFVT